MFVRLLLANVLPPVFGLPPGVTQATLGDIGLQEVDNLSTGVCTWIPSW